MEHYRTIAKQCLDGAENDKMRFPEIISTLSREGFDGYMVDFRNGKVVYYHNNNSIEFSIHGEYKPEIPLNFNIKSIENAVYEAQQNIDGYTYKAFCQKIMYAGCVGYIVSITGKRVLYLGRSAETHTEVFPK